MSRATEIEHETLTILKHLVDEYGDVQVEVSFRDAATAMVTASENPEYLNSPEAASFASTMVVPVVEKMIAVNDVESLIQVLRIGGGTDG